MSGVIPDDVVEYLAKTVKGSVRDLQGVLNTLMVYSINDNAEINVKLAEKIVKRVVRASDEPLSLDIIVDTVCETMNITPSDVNGKSRKKDTVLARQMVMYLAQKLTSLPSSRIGRLIGGRDHSTVIHSCKKMAQLITSDKTVAENVREIEKLLRTRKDK